MNRELAIDLGLPMGPPGGLTERMAELVYIPIYDLQQPSSGVLACLEVAISAVSMEALVANVISESADLLSFLQVSNRSHCAPAVAVVCCGSGFGCTQHGVCTHGAGNTYPVFVTHSLTGEMAIFWDICDARWHLTVAPQHGVVRFCVCVCQTASSSPERRTANQW